MKRIIHIFIVLLSLSFLFGCETTSNKIESQKSGEIKVSLGSGKDSKMELTPIVKAEPKNFKDDALGYYTIDFKVMGEAKASISKTKAQAGEEITISVTPEYGWKLEGIFVNSDGLPKNEYKFIMPEKNTEVMVYLLNIKHTVNTDSEHIVIDNNEALEETKFYFSINLNEDNYYYDFEDIKCYKQYDDYSTIEIEEENDGRYSFIVPNGDVNISFNYHEYRTINSIRVVDNNYENDYTDMAKIKLSIDGEEYSLGGKIKDKASCKLKLELPFEYEIYRLLYNDSYLFAFEEDTRFSNTYLFIFDSRFNSVDLNIVLYQPEGIYRAKCNETEHGTISIDKSLYLLGEEVNIEITPEDNYRLVSLQYKNDNNEIIKMGLYGPYHFTMPESNVVIEAKFSNNPVCHIEIESNSGNNYTPHDVFLNIVINDGEQKELDFDSMTIDMKPLTSCSVTISFNTENVTDYYGLEIYTVSNHEYINYHNPTWNVYSLKFDFVSPEEDIVILVKVG